MAFLFLFLFQMGKSGDKRWTEQLWFRRITKMVDVNFRTERGWGLTECGPKSRLSTVVWRIW